MNALIFIGVILLLSGCGGSAPRPRPAQAEEARPSFLTRVHDDCLAGDQWSCDLLIQLSNAMRSRGQ
ncbi:MAG TPA: hypothetical protein VMB73_22280 [Acetobacteraceae bacterium]|jgi:hypothetical protein|nr:hypothetical protein [Acetobacteraceae bacterium]